MGAGFGRIGACEIRTPVRKNIRGVNLQPRNPAGRSPENDNQIRSYMAVNVIG
jgi:hypothetical protein